MQICYLHTNFTYGWWESNSEDQPENKKLEGLTNKRLKNKNCPIIGKLNIDSIRSKFDFLCCKISPNPDLLLVSETKQRRSS